jgi:hypothetical protein
MMRKNVGTDGIGDEPTSLDSSPTLSTQPSVSTPSDEYLMALNKVSKAKSPRAKLHYLQQAEMIRMKG